MKARAKAVLSGLTALLMAGTLAACSSDPDPTPLPEASRSAVAEGSSYDSGFTAAQEQQLLILMTAMEDAWQGSPTQEKGEMCLMYLRDPERTATQFAFYFSEAQPEAAYSLGTSTINATALVFFQEKCGTGNW